MCSILHSHSNNIHSGIILVRNHRYVFVKYPNLRINSTKPQSLWSQRVCRLELTLFFFLTPGYSASVSKIERSFVPLHISFVILSATLCEFLHSRLRRIRFHSARPPASPPARRSLSLFLSISLICLSARPLVRVDVCLAAVRAAMTDLC